MRITKLKEVMYITLNPRYYMAFKIPVIPRAVILHFNGNELFQSLVVSEDHPSNFFNIYLLSSSFSPRISLILGALCISCSPVFTKLTGIPGLSSAFYRVIIAFAIFLPFAMYNRYYLIRPKKMMIALMCGLFFALDLGCWNQSLMISNAAVATVLGNLAPVWAGMLLVAFTRYKPSFYYWLGVVIALLGLVNMIGWSTIVHLEFDHGNLLALAASFFYACYMVLTSKAREGTSTMSFMFYSMLGYLVSAGIFVWWYGAPLSGFSGTTWKYLVALALVPQLLGWVLVNYALGTLPSTEVSMVLLSQIVLASIVLVLIFNEPLTFSQITGGLIILVGIAVTYIKKGKVV